MTFAKDRLPDPEVYYPSQGLVFREKRGKWRTTSCPFHGGSDSMRINSITGGFRCMACNAQGGDVLAFHRALHGEDFPTAARALGAWIEDGKPEPNRRPVPFPPRDAIQVLRDESLLIAIAGANVAHGIQLSDDDRHRVLIAANRIQHITEAFQ